MDHFEAIIFDMDGLLIDTEQLAMEAFDVACAHFGISGLEAQIKACIGTNSRMTQEILTPVIEPTVPYAEFRGLWENHYQEAVHSDRLQTKPGADTLLSHITTLGLPTALATSSSHQKARAKLKRTGLLHYFSVLVGGDEVTHSKPDPEIYLTAATKLGVNPQACLALEDSENGVKAAHAAGMTVIQVPDLVPPSEALRQLGHHIIDCLSQVPHIDFASGSP